ncbi:tetratricopeptide repeat protein [bacterium]|nr:tetratricopeptide repeat protein [bacterium]
MFRFREKWRKLSDPEMLVVLADQTYKLGRPKKALEMYRRAVELAPDHVAARVNLGALLIQCRHDLPEALVHMEYARTLEPDNCTVLLNLGSLYAHLDMAERSEAVLRRALEINPAFPDVRFLLAHHLINRGEMDEARRLLAEELSPGVKPGNLHAQMLLARLNEFRKQPPEKEEQP